MALTPMPATSWATAMLETVARPRWLSGIKKRSAIGASTPTWWRTRVRSGLVAGSISATTSNPGGGMTNDTDKRLPPALRRLLRQWPHACDGGLDAEQDLGLIAKLHAIELLL